MPSLQEHVASESAHWAASRRHILDDGRSSTTSSSADSIVSSAQLHSKYNTGHLSRRSSTSSFATEFEPEPQPTQPFVTPRDFNGDPITVYASFEAAVMQRTQLFEQGQGEGGVEETGVEALQPRRVVTPGKLYENEEDDDEIVYE
ncbi:hypothetical protein F4861DRAFT_498693 [Xylaria intraflava]|nr:hypothetical protein F4861DRAFT_498693 [Xylaria intraflava]